MLRNENRPAWQPEHRICTGHQITHGCLAYHSVFSGETEPIEDFIHTLTRDTYYKELVHTIMKAEKSHNHSLRLKAEKIDGLA